MVTSTLSTATTRHPTSKPGMRAACMSPRICAMQIVSASTPFESPVDATTACCREKRSPMGVPAVNTASISSSPCGPARMRRRSGVGVRGRCCNSSALLVDRLLKCRCDGDGRKAASGVVAPAEFCCSNVGARCCCCCCPLLLLLLLLLLLTKSACMRFAFSSCGLGGVVARGVRKICSGAVVLGGGGFAVPTLNAWGAHTAAGLVPRSSR